MELEQIIFNIIAKSGEARSLAMEGIQKAKKSNLDEARECIKKAEENLGLAHQEQTKLIQKESQGEKIETSILLIHAQDHLMNAMTVKDLASEIIDLYEFKNE